MFSSMWCVYFYWIPFAIVLILSGFWQMFHYHSGMSIVLILAGSILILMVYLKCRHKNKYRSMNVDDFLQVQQCHSLTPDADHDVEQDHRYGGLYINIPPSNATFTGPESPPPSYENSLFAKPVITPPPTYSAAIDNAGPPVWNSGAAPVPVHCSSNASHNNSLNTSNCFPQTRNGSSHNIQVSEHSSSTHGTESNSSSHHHSESHHTTDHSYSSPNDFSSCGGDGGGSNSGGCAD